MADLQKSDKVTKLSLTKIIVGFIVLDRFLFSPVRLALQRKGPLVKITFGKRAGRAKPKKAKGSKMKIFGFSLMAALGIAIIAIVAVIGFGWAKAKVEKTAAPAA